MALTDGEIDNVVETYTARDMARYERAATLVGERLARALRDAAFGRFLLSFRAKHPDTLREKLKRKREQELRELRALRAPRRKYPLATLLEKPGDVVTDLAGCRVIVYQPEHEEIAADVVRHSLPLAARPDASEAPKRLDTGYRATHVLVVVPDEPETLAIRGAICEVQVTSLASHLFNELEHDITYKDHGVQVSPNSRSLVEILRRSTRAVDDLSRLLVSGRAAEVIRATARLTGPEQLRHALEQEFDRPLRGGAEYERLFRLLNGVLLPLTVTALKSAGNLSDLCEEGAAVAKSLGLETDNDVVNLALGLLPNFQTEFIAIVRGWRGPITPLKDALLRAAEHGGH